MKGNETWKGSEAGPSALSCLSYPEWPSVPGEQLKWQLGVLGHQKERPHSPMSRAWQFGGVPGSFRSQPGRLSIPSALMDSAEARLLQLRAARGQERRQRPNPLPLLSATVTGRSPTPLFCLPPLSVLQTPSREYSQHYGGRSEKEQGWCIGHQECSEYVGSVRLGWVASVKANQPFDDHSGMWAYFT